MISKDSQYLERRRLLRPTLEIGLSRIKGSMGKVLAKRTEKEPLQREIHLASESAPWSVSRLLEKSIKRR